MNGQIALPRRGAPEDEGRITLELLAAVERNEAVTQRSLSRDLGIALGLANGLLKRCVTKGLIKITQAPANRYAYYLTPHGFAEKSRLVAEFLSNSFVLLRVARRELGDLFVECGRRGWPRLALWGGGDLADIAVLTLAGMGLQPVGVIDPARAGAEPNVVASLAELDGVDAVIVTDLSNPQGAFDAACAVMDSDRVLTAHFLHVSRQRPRLVE